MINLKVFGVIQIPRFHSKGHLPLRLELPEV